MPLETIFVKSSEEDNIKTTMFSEEITEFSYLNRMNFRKYGANFLYDSHLAFHRLKTMFKNEEEREGSNLTTFDMRSRLRH